MTFDLFSSRVLAFTLNSKKFGYYGQKFLSNPFVPFEELRKNIM